MLVRITQQLLHDLRKDILAGVGQIGCCERGGAWLTLDGLQRAEV